MAHHYIWLNANPEYRERLRQANEERAAAFYAAWRVVAGALGNAFRRLAEAHRRAARARETLNALSALSDHQLNDIGLVRGEIRSIARAVAEEPPEATVTLADLRRLRSGAPASRGTRAARPPRDADRRGRPAPWAARKAPEPGERAAG